MSAVAEGLRAAADLIEQHPELPAPYVTSAHEGAEVFWFLQDEADQKANAQAVLRALGGRWDKTSRAEDATMNFRQTSGLLKMLVQVAREAVCERIVVGTETVTHPAKPAEPERTETVEKVEWRCESVLSEATS